MQNSYVQRSGEHRAVFRLMTIICSVRYSGKCQTKVNLLGAILIPAQCSIYYSAVRKNVWNMSDMPAAVRGIQNLSFYYSFDRPTTTKWLDGCFGAWKICIWQQFLKSKEHEVTKGLLRQCVNFACRQQFWTSNEHELTRGLRRQRERFAFRSSP